MHPTHAPWQKRTGLAAVVLGLHLLGLLLALRLGAWADRGPPPPPARAPLRVWLQAPPPTAARTSATPTAAPVARPAPRQPAPPGPREPQAITLPALPADAEPPAATAPLSSVPDAVAPVAPPALNLALPRGASAPWRGSNPALDDPRANTPRPTLDSRIAQALGGGDLITEYRLEDGSVRLRRGNACVVVRPNRAHTLDPFNGSAQIRPRLLDRC